MRAAEFAAFSAFALIITPYKPTRYKVLVAALFGYAIADLVVSNLWYCFHLGGWYFATSLQSASFLFFSFRFWINSFDSPSDIPEPTHIYCLRLIPDSPQSLIINMFQSNSYAIYCCGYVYYFNRGFLVKRKFAKPMLSKYHATIGSPLNVVAIEELESMIGLKWSFFGANCIKTLGKFWGQHAR
jgi:hypothetical protein